MLIKGFALLLLLLIPVIIFTARKHVPSPKILFLTPTPTNAPTISPTITQSPSVSVPTPTVINTIPPQIITSAPSPTQATSSTGSLNDFIYPNSSVQSQSGNAVTLLSTDDATVITNWFKNKIQQLGMNTTSFITTNTNGNVSNKLVASNGSLHISVDISKSPGSNQVTVAVSLQ